ncbi:MAG: aromatic amino acid DMT transporter YddG [Deltaproteobacteria bacterium]|nr:aromatic amino acid DMT transporter YddG [Deltaproteobacteria bacterium]
MPKMPVLTKEQYGNIYALLAILFWSSTFAVGRTVTEQLGTIRSTAYMYLIGGLFGMILFYTRAEKRAALFNLSSRFYIYCGFFFILFSFSLYSSIGFALNRTQMVEVGLINYLWPSLTIIFAIPLHKLKARWWIVLGMLLATYGISLSANRGASLNFAELIVHAQQNLFSYGLAFLAAISWALYSNLTKLYAPNGGDQAIPIFVFLAGITFLCFSVFVPERSIWDLHVLTELVFLALVPTCFAYIFWSRALQHGNLVIISALSYATPLLASIFSCLYLSIEFTQDIFFGAIAVILGSVICSKSVVNHKK